MRTFLGVAFIYRQLPALMSLLIFLGGPIINNVFFIA